jgi:hypothetical protein
MITIDKINVKSYGSPLAMSEKYLDLPKLSY